MSDLGGLSFPIEIQDRFSDDFRKFTRFVAEATAAVKQLRRAKDSLGKGTTRIVKKFGQDLRNEAKSAVKEAATGTSSKAATAKRKEAKQDAQANKIKALELKILKEQEALKVRAIKLGSKKIQIAQQENRELRKNRDQALRAARAEETAVLRVNNARRKGRAEAQKFFDTLDKNRSLRAARQNRSQFRALNSVFSENLETQVTAPQRQALLVEKEKAKALADTAKRNAEAIKQQRRLTTTLKKGNTAGTRFLFTFRRLVGVLAAFTIAREAAQAFGTLVRSGISFNSQVESSRLGIGALVASSSDLVDEFGRVVKGGEALNRAIGIADEQVQQLKVDARETTASFADLVKTFQIATGPGLAQGLNLDEIRNLTKSISQAASALDVPQNQLSEEIRSLLSGTIQQRTTRIAAALGITNEDIRRVKEAGELYPFLVDQLKAFNAAGKRVGDTTSGAFNRLVQVVQEAAGEGFLPLNKLIKDTSNSLFALFRSGQARDSLVAGFRGVADILTDILQSAISLARDGFGAIRAVVDILGPAISGVLSVTTKTFSVLSSIFEGMVAGVNALVRPLNAIGISVERIAQAFTILFLARAVIPRVIALFITLKGVLAGIAAINVFGGIFSVLGVGVKVLTAGLLAAGAAFAVFGTGAGKAEEQVNSYTKTLDELKTSLKDITKEQKTLNNAAEDILFGRTQNVGSSADILKRLQALKEQERLELSLKRIKERELKSIPRQNVVDEAKLKTLDEQAFLQEKLNELTGALGSEERANAEIRLRETAQFRRELEQIGQQLDDNNSKLLETVRAAGQGPTRGAEDTIGSLLAPTFSIDSLSERALKVELSNINVLREKEKSIIEERNELEEALGRIIDARQIALSKQNEENRKLAQSQRQLIVDQQKNTENAGTTRRAQESLRIENEILSLRAQANQEGIRGNQDQEQFLENQAQRLEQLKAQSEDGIQLFNTAALLNDFADAERTFDDFLAGTAVAITDTLGSAFVESFEGNSESVKEIFADLVRSLAKQLATLAFQNLLGGFLAPGTGGLRVGSGATGGYVRGSGKIGDNPYGFMRRGVQGFAKGGPVKPNWVDSRDTIPAWLRPGEFVVRPEAVRLFRPLLEEINSLKFKGGSFKPPTKPSYATGGFVAPRQTGSQNSSTVVNMPPPVIVYDRQQAEDLRNSRAGRTLLSSQSAGVSDKDQESF